MAQEIPNTDDLSVAKIAAALALISTTHTYRLADTSLDDRLRMFIRAHEVIAATIADPQRARDLLSE